MDEGSSGFKVSLAEFDGPIDLLLHLVKSRELCIERLSLAQVAEQYLAAIQRLHDLDLEVASEYLVVAATLLSIKASALLSEKSEFESELEEHMPDPHRELLEMLRQAQVYKAGAQQLSSRDLLGLHVFRAPDQLADIETPQLVYLTHDALLLGEAFRKLIERTGADKRLFTIQADSVSVIERMISILDALRAAGAPLPFTALLSGVSGKIGLIGSFIALLELTKRRAIAVRQEGDCGEIYIALSGEDLSTLDLTADVDRAMSQVASMSANG